MAPPIRVSSISGKDHAEYVVQLLIAPDPEVPGREGQIVDRGRRGDDGSCPKGCQGDFFHDEDHGDDVGYLVIALDQKFLIERLEDEDVTELTIPVRNLGGST